MYAPHVRLSKKFYTAMMSTLRTKPIVVAKVSSVVVRRGPFFLLVVVVVVNCVHTQPQTVLASLTFKSFFLFILFSLSSFLPFIHFLLFFFVFSHVSLLFTCLDM